MIFGFQNAQGAILNTEAGNIEGSRFIFQSRQPNGGGTDIFVADIDGGRRCNLTEKDYPADDTLFDDHEQEVGRWVGSAEIEYCSMRGGRKSIERRPDCIHNLVDNLGHNKPLTTAPLVVLVHGIRTYASWHREFRPLLERHHFDVELTNYGRFDLVRFLLPISRAFPVHSSA
jgi:hypothetical protein